jgi:tetratricopeptide (TPR) repeat protein
MMRRLCAGLLLAVWWAVPVFAADPVSWKSLHERAERMSLEEARQAARDPAISWQEAYVAGVAFLYLYRIDDARAVFERVSRAAPDMPAARWGQAEVLRRAHELEESRMMLDEILAKDPVFYPAHLSRGYIAFMQGDFSATAKHAGAVMFRPEGEVDTSNYVRACSMYSGAKGMLAHYGGPMAKVTNGSVVLSTLKKAQRLQPEAPAVLFGLGSFYLLAPKFGGGDLDHAIEYLEKAVAADPLFADAYVRLSQAYKKKGNAAGATKSMEKALALDPKNELARDVSTGTCRFICP